MVKSVVAVAAVAYGRRRCCGEEEGDVDGLEERRRDGEGLGGEAAISVRREAELRLLKLRWNWHGRWSAGGAAMERSSSLARRLKKIKTKGLFGLSRLKENEGKTEMTMGKRRKCRSVDWKKKQQPVGGGGS